MIVTDVEWDGHEMEEYRCRGPRSNYGFQNQNSILIMMVMHIHRTRFKMRVSVVWATYDHSRVQLPIFWEMALRVVAMIC